MSQKITEEELALINSYAQTELSEKELFTFSVVLCDDSVDRDLERFSLDALHKLAELFKGRTGIFDHDPKGGNQTARIYSCEVVHDADSGVNRLLAKAYMVRTEGNADLIAEIKGGIKKEVSVSCSVAKKLCSVCGADIYKEPCMHIKGRDYDGRTCVHILDEPTDAYEWSFVAVPAQKGAGVTKTFTDGERVDKLLADEEARLREEILRMSYFCKPFVSAEAVSAMTSAMNSDQLKSLKLRLRKAMLEDEERYFSEEQNYLPTDGKEENLSYKC